MAKSKSKYIMVYLKSVVSGHQHVFIKPRIAKEKIEAWKWDPFIQQMCLYKEAEKIKAAKY